MHTCKKTCSFDSISVSLMAFTSLGIDAATSSCSAGEIGLSLQCVQGVAPSAVQVSAVVQLCVCVLDGAVLIQTMWTCCYA